jgi:hypothetical protein
MEAAMRHMRTTRRIILPGRAILLLLALGGALASCTATATETAMPYGYGGPGATYYEDPADLGYEPFSGELSFDDGLGFRHFHHPGLHHFAGAHGFAHHGFGHGFAHGGFAHGARGGGHGR